MKFLTEKIVLKLLKLEKIDRSIVISDPYQKDCPMVFISDEFAKHTGYGVKESLGKTAGFLQGPETDDNDIQQIKLALKLEKRITIDILNYKKDGEKFWNRLRIIPIFDDKKTNIFCWRTNPIPMESVRRYTFNKIID